MNHRRLLVVTVAVLFSSVTTAEESELHVWTSRGGDYSTQARLLGTETDREQRATLLILEKKDGGVIKVPIDRLSKESRQLAERIIAQRRSSATGKRSTKPERQEKRAALTEPDHKKLTSDLEALSTAWVQESVESANKILWKPEYTRDHWREFFSTYFGNHPFTGDLLNYLQYPVFGWGPELAHVELQEGIASVLEELVARSIKPRGRALGAALNADPVLLQTLCKATLFLNKLAGSKDLSPETRQRLYRFHLDLIAGCNVLSTRYTIDISKHPYLGRIRGQLYMNVADFALPDVADPQALTLRALSQQAKDEIAKVISLRGQRLEIWQKHSVLVIDNNGLDARQLAGVGRLFDLVPPELHNLGVVTVREFLGEDVDWYGHVVQSVNIGGVRIGQAKENPFPDDVPPHETCIFWGIWVHEFNHVVDFYYVKHDNPYRKRLIEQAGSVSTNYLRSMFAGDTFVKAPQEFFASISNQYFADSLRTLELGLVRFDKGIKEPLRQFLFFADVYSLKGDQTFFYQFDTQGNIERRTVELTRDANGLINGLKTNGKHYQFVRDQDGGVVSYSVE